MMIRGASVLRVAISIPLLALAACDPVVNVAGANFPAWLLCVIVGAIMAMILRQGFAASGIEPHLGPLLLIYPCLAMLLACLIYLIFFSRI